jgi:hypothetical protein
LPCKSGRRWCADRQGQRISSEWPQVQELTELCARLLSSFELICRFVMQARPRAGLSQSAAVVGLSFFIRTHARTLGDSFDRSNASRGDCRIWMPWKEAETRFSTLWCLSTSPQSRVDYETRVHARELRGSVHSTAHRHHWPFRLSAWFCRPEFAADCTIILYEMLSDGGNVSRSFLRKSPGSAD